jgi:hypothetical protein
MVSLNFLAYLKYALGSAKKVTNPLILYNFIK